MTKPDKNELKPTPEAEALQMRISRTDALLLDPPKYRKLQNWLNSLAIVFICLALIAWYAISAIDGVNTDKTISTLRIVLTATTAGLAVICLILTFVFMGMKCTRFARFNASPALESFLITAYEHSKRVGGFSAVPDDGTDPMPVLSLRSSRLAKDAQIEKVTDRLTISLANAGRPLVYRVATYYDPSVMPKMPALSERKVVIVAMPSISKHTFYLAQTNLNFGHPNFATINNLTLHLTASGKKVPWHLYEAKDQITSIFNRLSKRTLAEGLFNPRQTSAGCDFYNDADGAFLIVAAPSIFMKTRLEGYELLSDYTKNMQAQAEIDLTVLSYIAHLRDVVEQHLILPEGVTEQESPTAEQPSSPTEPAPA